MLNDLLRSSAAAVPGHPLVVSDAGTLTYGEALERAEACARGLVARGVERFAVVLSDPREVLPLLCGASAAGSEACVIRPDLETTGVDELLEQFGQSVVVTDRSLAPAGSEVLTAAELARDGDGPLPVPSAAPVLILTTGTTGRPRGARHDWSRLVATTRRVRPAPDARWLLAYNLNQFAGIQVLLHVLASRGTLVAPRTTQPRDAVKAMRRHGVTHASATPTFWRFALALLQPENTDALALEQVTLGGEAVPEPLLAHVRERFPRARVSQVYAATEFGTAVSVRDGHAGLPLSVLNRPEGEVQFKIVDGELHARSSAGMLGYYGEPDFEGGWRPTGDLVEVRDDRIVFVGRASDTINVGGVKVHPLPVEERVAAVPGVALARAYGRPNPVTGEILVVDVVPEPGADVEALPSAVRAACSALGAAARPRRVRIVDEIRVEGHKIARARPPS